MTEYYEIVDFEKLTCDDFFKRYFPEMCKDDEEIEDYFGIVCDIRNQILYKQGFLKVAKSIREQGADPRYIRENEKRMKKLLSQKGWEDFPFRFVTPFDDDCEHVLIGTLKEKKVLKYIIVGNTIFYPTDN